MRKQVLHTGQNDFALTCKIDYEDGSQITLEELENAQKLEILYAYKDYDGTNTAESSWLANGYHFDGDTPYIFYSFVAEDLVPADVDRLVGRVKITNEDGLISYGRAFDIQVLSSSL